MHHVPSAVPPFDGRDAAVVEHGAEGVTPLGQGDARPVDHRTDGSDRRHQRSAGVYRPPRRNHGRPLARGLTQATYLPTATIVHFDVRTGRTPGGIPVYMANDPFLSDTNGEDVYGLTDAATDYWSSLFGPYPGVRGDEGHRRQRAAGRLLAGTADEARGLVRALRHDCRARAGPSAVRRRGHTVEGTSGSTRASRPTRPGCSGLSIRAPPPHTTLLADYDSRPADSAFWAGEGHRPAARHPLQFARLPPRCDDASGPARTDRDDAFVALCAPSI